MPSTRRYFASPGPRVEEPDAEPLVERRVRFNVDPTIINVSRCDVDRYPPRSPSSSSSSSSPSTSLPGNPGPSTSGRRKARPASVPRLRLDFRDSQPESDAYRRHDYEFGRRERAAIDHMHRCYGSISPGITRTCIVARFTEADTDSTISEHSHTPPNMTSRRISPRSTRSYFQPLGNSFSHRIASTIADLRETVEQLERRVTTLTTEQRQRKRRQSFFGCWKLK
jgi:hypothetical protein